MAVIGVIAFSLSAACRAQVPGKLTQVFDRPATTSLSSGAQFFQPVKQTLGTTLPVTSMVVDETSATEGAVTVPEPAGNTGPPAPVVTPISVPVSPAQVDLSPREENAAQSLPVKVDNSSTEAQVMQLAEFEKRNQIGEAFLLAVELVHKNPKAEFTFDAAIRNSLVLGLEKEIERYYREAIKQSELPGKYYVQLAHYYQRTGRMTELQKLISDYAKGNSDATDYRITLARLFAVAGDQEALTALFDKQGFNSSDIFPLLQIQIKAYIDAGEDDKATTRIMSALRREFGMPQQRLLLQEILRLKSPNPADVVALVQASLANETDYKQARQVADNVVREASHGRYMTQVSDYLTSQAAGRRLTDVERWLYALITEKTGDEKHALEILTAETAGNTPVIASERARALIKANRTREAISILATLLAEQPDELETRLLLAEQMNNLRQTTNTLQLLGSLRFHNLPPDQQDRYARLMVASHILNRDVGRLLETWEDIAPQASFDVLQAMGDTVVGLATDASFRHRVAAATLDRIESRPDTWPLYLLLARLSATDREPLAELKYYGEYLEHDRDNVKMLRFVAELALLHANVPLTFAPENSATSGGVTLRASQSEATAAAVQFYRRLIDLQPRLPENYSALMRAYQTRGEVGTAKKVALEFADRASSTPQALSTAANMLNDNGFREDALSMYRTALLAGPDQFDTWMNYATALREAGKFQPATDILKKILEEGLHGVPYNQPAVFANLLAIAQDSGTTPALAQYLDTVRQKPIPGKAEFTISAAKVLMQIGVPEEARKFLEEFVREQPGNKLVPDALLLLGQLQYMAGDLDAALNTFTAVRDEHSTTPAAITAAFNRAEIQRRQGNVNEAIETWLKIAEEHPDNDKALTAIRVAALSAFNDLNDANRAAELLEQFLASGTQDYKLLQKARRDLENIRAGKPPASESAQAAP
jgi:tetratricopeptide (TPR) repeat protein